MKKILLASNNKHKAQEFNEIFNQLIPGQIQLVLPSELSNKKIDVEETGTSFIENSYIKAKEYFKLFNMPVISDDSGLEVDALFGEPGINSARYSGVHGDDALNREFLLKNLKDAADRNANFIAVLCYYDGNEPIFFEGKVYGEIITDEKGEGGFGYDPLFIPTGYTGTFAEMKQEEKNKISHRALALQRFCEYFSKHIEDS